MSNDANNQTTFIPVGKLLIRNIIGQDVKKSASFSTEPFTLWCFPLESTTHASTGNAGTSESLVNTHISGKIRSILIGCRSPSISKIGLPGGNHFRLSTPSREYLKRTYPTLIARRPVFVTLTTSVSSSPLSQVSVTISHSTVSRGRSRNAKALESNKLNKDKASAPTEVHIVTFQPSAPAKLGSTVIPHAL